MTQRKTQRTKKSGPDAQIRAIAKLNRKAAMNQVVMTYGTRLTYHAFRIVKDQQEACDAVQEVFIKAMRESRFFDDGFEIRAWLFRVTTNLCYNIVRDKRRRQGILANMPEESAPQGRSPEISDLMMRGEMREGMLGAIDRLTPKHREILLLRYYRDLSYREIADVLKIQLGTVMSRLSRARNRLGGVLGDENTALAV